MILGLIKGILGEAQGIIGSVVKDPNQAEELKRGLERLMIERGSEAEIAETNGKVEIMKAELQQGDKFTKRARPWIVYGGLIIIALNHVLLPWISWAAMYFKGAEIALPAIVIPGQFWTAWGGAVSIYAIGRTYEKAKYKKLFNAEGSKHE